MPPARRASPAAAQPTLQAAAPAEAGAAPIEIELKLLVPEASHAALRERLLAYGPPKALTIESVYFDTPGRLLLSRRAALRVRRIEVEGEARWVQTLKTGNTDTALTRRGEWEVPVAGPRLAPSRLADAPLAELLGGARSQLAPVFRSRFERTVHEVRIGESVIELALDRGYLQAGRRREPISELELEMRAGDTAAVFDLALDLIGRGRAALPLMPGVESKAMRGYRLADRSVAIPAGAGAETFAAALEAPMDCSSAARRILELGVSRVLANVAGASIGTDLEFVHQSRVALRRTRSALRLLGAASADDPVARDLRWLSDRYGEVRDWDVLVTQWLPALGKAIGCEGQADWVRLMARAERRRQMRRRRLSQTLASPLFARTAIRLLQWAQAPHAAGRELRTAAPSELQRGHRRLLAAGTRIGRLSVAQRHRLRILAKRQRYACELLAPIMGKRSTARSLKLLARLQQTLGEVNDIQVTLSVMPSLTSSRQILEMAERWARRQMRRSLPKAAGLLKRLQRQG